MATWNDLAQWLYPDVQKAEGFWYAQPLWEIEGLTDEDLYWVPDNNAFCILWHVGHIAHREAYHMQRIIRGREGEIIPSKFEVFGTEWCSVKTLQESIDSTDDVFKWVASVRRDTKDLISSFKEEDFIHG